MIDTPDDLVYELRMAIDGKDERKDNLLHEAARCITDLVERKNTADDALCDLHAEFNQFAKKLKRVELLELCPACSCILEAKRDEKPK